MNLIFACCHIIPELCLFPRNCENPATQRFVRGRIESRHLPRCSPRKNKSQTLLVVGRTKRSSPRESPLPPSPAQDHPKTRGDRQAAGPLPQPRGGVCTENRAPRPGPLSERRGLGGLQGAEVATTKHCPARDVSEPLVRSLQCR